MATLPPCRALRSNATWTHPETIFPFLAPSIQSRLTASHTSVARFSTSPRRWKADNNKNRGVSALRHTGPRKRQTLSIKKYTNNGEDLPVPVSAADKQPLQGDDDHGLWGFFKDKKLLRTPVDESRHGRAWTVAELRKRTWSDLHSLWWVCVKERNRLATEKIERARQKAGYGDFENKQRDGTVQETMKAIRETLLERHSAWEEAYHLAQKDPNIDLAETNGPQYKPADFYDAEALGNDGDHLEGKDMPGNYFNTKENPPSPPSITEKVKQRTNKILWNK